MASVEVALQPSMLTWLLQKVGDEGTVATLLQAWLSGTKKPTVHQIEVMSKKTHIPFGYFFLKDPPASGCTIGAITLENPSGEVAETVNTMSSAQEWMVQYHKRHGDDPLSFVGRFPENVTVETLVGDIRNVLGLSEDWFLCGSSASDSFRMAREAIEKRGVMVMVHGVVGSTHRKLDVNEIRSFTMIDPYAPLIFLNAHDPEKLFSLFHELAPVWLGKDSYYRETIGEAVAWEMLVPERLFLQKWNETTGEPFFKIQDVAQYFRCTPWVIARRALATHAINKDTYDAMMLELQEHGDDSRDRKPERKWDRNFIKALSQSVQEGKTLYTEAYALTKTTGKTFDALVRTMKGK